MHLEALEIHNFRGIKECKSALPNKRVLCLIGAGDSTKSTILDAVFLNLLPNWNINATDSDFYEGDTSKAITISCTYSEFPEAFLAEDKFGFYLRSGAAICSSFLVDNVGTSWDDEIRNGENGCLTLRLTIDSSLEPKWEIICNRLQPKSIGVTDRRTLLCSFIGTEINGDFSWGRNSILHRYADGKGELRSAYQDAFRAAAQVVHFNSLDSISDAVITAGKQYSVPIAEYLANGSIAVTCKRIGITEQTAYNWLNAGLREIIDETQDKLFNERLDKQCMLLDRSTDRLEQLIEDEKTPAFAMLNIWKALNDSVYKNKQCIDIQKKLDEVRELYKQQEEDNAI
jgi:hypothetical protein